MPQKLRHLLVRHDPVAPVTTALKAGAGKALGLGAVAGLGAATGLPLLMAPLGASAVIALVLPTAPVAQPINMLGGYLVCTLIGIGVALALPHSWWAVALGAGLALAAMLLLRVTHPPAGAMPILAQTASVPPFEFLVIAATGALLLIVIATLYHRLPPRTDYPRRG
jgi:CBS-domain-containing membrane protein